MTFRLSASKLKRYLQCPRAYHLSYVAKVPEDARGQYLVIGTAYDLHVQWYLSRGERGVQSIDPRILRMFDAARRLLPEPGSVEVQNRYSIAHPDGFVIEGTPDLRRPGWLGDTKTTAARGPGEGSAMTSEQLARDIQFRLYSWCELALGASEPIVGVWSYVNKDSKPKAWNVSAKAWRGELEAWFDTVVRPAAVAMATIEAECDSDRVVANLDACDGCWVKKHCTPFDGPNFYDWVDSVQNLVQLSVKAPATGEKQPEEKTSMAFDMSKLSAGGEDDGLVSELEASVKTAKAARAPAAAPVIAINPPRKETPTETNLEDLASELQTVVDQCQSAIARVDRLLASLRAKTAGGAL